MSSPYAMAGIATGGRKVYQRQPGIHIYTCTCCINYSHVLIITIENIRPSLPINDISTCTCMYMTVLMMPFNNIIIHA